LENISKCITSQKNELPLLLYSVAITLLYVKIQKSESKKCASCICITVQHNLDKMSRIISMFPKVWTCRVLYCQNESVQNCQMFFWVTCKLNFLFGKSTHHWTKRINTQLNIEEVCLSYCTLFTFLKNIIYRIIVTVFSFYCRSDAVIILINYN